MGNVAMKSLTALMISAVCAILVSAAGTSSLAAIPSRPAPGAAKADLYDVVKIGDDLKVIKKSELVGLKKSTADENKKDLKAYQDAKRSATKSKDKSAMPPKPVKRSVVVLKASLKSDAEAEAWLDKYLKDKKGGLKAGNAAGAW